MRLSFSRKMYWTDGDNISMANMDGSNRTMLFTNQKGPVGEWVNTNTLAYNNAEQVEKSDDVLLTGVSIVHQLPGNLVHNSDS